jgi:hypothetical protein
MPRIARRCKRTIMPLGGSLRVANFGGCGVAGRCADGKTLIVDVDFRRGLSVAVYRGDVAAIMAELDTEAVRSMPQFAGDALLVALSGDAPGADALARDCLATLQGRCWDGDAELVDALGCALGAPAAAQLTPVPVQVDQLIDLLQGGGYQTGGRLNVRTGEVLPEIGYTDLIASGPLDDEEEEDEDGAPDDDEDWISVDPLGTRESYRDMQRFVATQVPPPIAERLSDAISGKGAFARFRTQIEKLPELEDDWRSYREERWRGRARQWLADAGYRPSGSPQLAT